MTTKSDDRVAQPETSCNENGKEAKSQEDQLPKNDAMRAMAESLEQVLRREIDKHPEMTAEDAFESVTGFLEAVAGAIHMTLDSFENIIHDKDHAYPMGLLTPIFLSAFMQQGGAHCQIMRLPEELTEKLAEMASAPVPKDMLN